MWFPPPVWGKGSKVYVKLGARVPTTAMGAWGEGSNGVRVMLYYIFGVSTPLWGQRDEEQGRVRGARG